MMNTWMSKSNYLHDPADGGMGGLTRASRGHGAGSVESVEFRTPCSSLRAPRYSRRNCGLGRRRSLTVRLRFYQIVDKCQSLFSATSSVGCARGCRCSPDAEAKSEKNRPPYRALARIDNSCQWE